MTLNQFFTPTWAAELLLQRYFPGLTERDEPDSPECKWSQDEYGTSHTACGNAFEFNEGGPTDNGFKFCSYCGKEIEEEVSNEND